MADPTITATVSPAGELWILADCVAFGPWSSQRAIEDPRVDFEHFFRGTCIGRTTPRGGTQVSMTDIDGNPIGDVPEPIADLAIRGLVAYATAWGIGRDRYDCARYAARHVERHVATGGRVRR